MLHSPRMKINKQDILLLSVFMALHFNWNDVFTSIDLFVKEIVQSPTIHHTAGISEAFCCWSVSFQEINGATQPRKIIFCDRFLPPCKTVCVCVILNNFWVRKCKTLMIKCKKVKLSLCFFLKLNTTP